LGDNIVIGLQRHKILIFRSEFYFCKISEMAAKTYEPDQQKVLHPKNVS
jgi:hypothetical protein